MYCDSHSGSTGGYKEDTQYAMYLLYFSEYPSTVLVPPSCICTADFHVYYHHFVCPVGIVPISFSEMHRDTVVFRGSFNRPNLHYSVRPKPSTRKDALAETARIIKEEFSDGLSL